MGSTPDVSNAKSKIYIHMEKKSFLQPIKFETINTTDE
jgi:hypothetical protein